MAGEGPEHGGLNLWPAFAVPFADVSMPDAGPLLESLRELFLQKEAEGDRWRDAVRRDTQYGGVFESRFDLFEWPEPEVRQLAAFCHHHVASVVRMVSRHSDEDFRRLVFDYEAWFHVTRAGGYQGSHNHQNHSWSGIFCVDPGDEVPDRPESGTVRFLDPRGGSNMHLDAGNDHLHMPYNTGGISWRHEPGRLLIFPSFLLHEIFPYVGDRPRVVVAFNCRVRKGRKA